MPSTSIPVAPLANRRRSYSDIGRTKDERENQLRSGPVLAVINLLSAEYRTPPPILIAPPYPMRNVTALVTNEMRLKRIWPDLFSTNFEMVCVSGVPWTIASHPISRRSGPSVPCRRRTTNVARWAQDWQAKLNWWLYSIHRVHRVPRLINIYCTFGVLLRVVKLETAWPHAHNTKT